MILLISRTLLYLFQTQGTVYPKCNFQLLSSKDGKTLHRTHEALETEEVKQQRFQTATTRKIRKLSGWNVFCRERMAGESFEPSQYSQNVKQIGAEWKALPDDQRRAYEVEAQHQEELRAKLAFTPLSIGEAAKNPTEMEAKVGRKACKRLSARRLSINDAIFADSSIWSLPTCFCDSHLHNLYL